MASLKTFSSLGDLHSYQNLRAELAVTAGDGDPWGWCMSWWFAIAGRLHDTGENIPADWHYRPSPFGGANPDAFEDSAIAELEISPAALVYAGNVLSRYARACKHAGLDYRPLNHAFTVSFVSGEHDP